jgi:Sulfatase
MRLPSYPWRFAHLAALWGYGVSQPVFSMLKGNPEFLVVRGSTRSDVIAFAVLLAFLPPLLVVAVEALVSLVTAAVARALHIVAIWGFAFLAGLQLLRLVDPERGATLLLPMIPALLVALLYVRSRALRSFFSLSFALPVIGCLSFMATVPLAVDDRPGVDVEVATNTPVVLVTFDEFPLSSLLRADGSLDAVRYPNFARLANEATWYPHATTVHASTTHAVPAILTGQAPRRGELPTLRDHPDNLFTLLGERYAIRASEQATRLCPTRYCPRLRDEVPLVDRQRGLFYDVYVGYLHRVLPQSLRGGLPPIGERWGGFGDEEEVDVRELVLGALDTNAWDAALATARDNKPAQFERFLRSVRAGHAGRTLLFEHALLPHSPWSLLPSGRAYGSPSIVEGIDDDWIRWGASQQLVEQALQRHLLQVGFTDRLLGTLVRRLKTSELYDRALLIVTADHGASFWAGGFFREPSAENIADIAAVPLFVKYPGQHRSRIDGRDAKTIDIVPTIADVIGARIPWHVDGRSLRATPAAREVAVNSFREATVTARPQAVSEGVLATARRNASLFGEGADSLFRLGPHKELLGREVATLEPSRVADAVVRLDDESRFDQVRRASAFVPARILGEIDASAFGAGSELAISVNGRVAAMTTSFERGGQIRFAALVPETAFREGRNAVDVYAVGSSSSGVRLALLGGAGEGRSVAKQLTERASGSAPA